MSVLYNFNMILEDKNNSDIKKKLIQRLHNAKFKFRNYDISQILEILSKNPEHLALDIELDESHPKYKKDYVDFTIHFFEKEKQVSICFDDFIWLNHKEEESFKQFFQIFCDVFEGHDKQINFRADEQIIVKNRINADFFKEVFKKDEELEKREKFWKKVTEMNKE